MTTATDRYVTAQNAAVRLAVRDLRTFWGRLDHSDPLASRVALERFWPVLLARYGEITATLAVDRFEDLTGLPGVMVRPVDADRANARMGWAMGPAFKGDPDASYALLAGLVDELVKQPGRSSLIASASEHGLSYARVPVGETCAFCLMLASRGFVYSTRAAAGDMRKYHGGCDCRVAVESEPTPGYDPDDLYDRYLTARRDAGSGDPKKVLAAMRENESIH